MSRLIGTVSRGIRTPIVRQGDDIVEVVVSSVLQAVRENGIEVHDKDIVAVTESVVARAQG
ncbi:MAG: coenzyme F420-0:L-glutamate ligase, partial [Oscillospiraceae bacterium]|nr:coenzyme F420-0:L-glutamate ligase [Oscillospiraceae bacterium]